MVDCNRFQETLLSRAFRKVFRRKLSLTALALGTPGLAMALPVLQQSNVVYGTLSSSNPDPSTLKILQRSSKAIANFDSFNIAGDEHVIISQPGQLSAFLGRVTGTDPTTILGSLQANGRVFLVNPYGITFGAGANVDVGSLVATTLNISDQDFINNNLIFQRSADSPETAKVINQGTIQTASNGGFVVLAGDYAQNTGLIEAHAGQVVLASGSQMTMTLNMGGLVSFAVNEKTLSSLAGVDNAGQILADGGRVIMTAKVAGDLAATAVNNEGQVQADGISTSGGQIYLTAEGGQGVENSGTLSADTVDGNSGSVQITADTNIENAGSISASGAAGGVNAGGSVTLVADGTLTLKKGSQVSVDGGVDGGNGGFLELSGKTINTRGSYSGAARAAGYANGSLVMDPSNIIIDSAGNTISHASSSPGTAAATVEVSKILNGFSNVTLNATNNIDVGRGPSFHDQIKANLMPGKKLTLNAGNDININNDIGQSSVPYSGRLKFTAGNSINVHANIYTKNSVVMHANTAAGGGNVNIIGSSATYGGGGGSPADVTVMGKNMVITGADVNIEGASNVQASAGGANHTVIKSGSVTVKATGGMTISADSSIRIRGGHAHAQASGSGSYLALAVANATVSVGTDMILVAGHGSKVVLGGGRGSAAAQGSSAGAKTQAVAQTNTSITVGGALKIYHSVGASYGSAVGDAGVFGGKSLTASAMGSGSNKAQAASKTSLTVTGDLTALAGKVAVVGFGQSPGSPANITAHASGASSGAHNRAGANGSANVSVGGNLDVAGGSSYGGKVVLPTQVFGVIGQFAGSDMAHANGSGSDSAAVNTAASLAVKGHAIINVAERMAVVGGSNSYGGMALASGTMAKHPGVHNADATQSASLNVGQYLVVQGGVSYGGTVNAVGSMDIVGAQKGEAVAGHELPFTPDGAFGINRAKTSASASVITGGAAVLSVSGDLNVLGAGMAAALNSPSRNALALGTASTGNNNAAVNMSAVLDVGRNLLINGGISGSSTPANSAGYVNHAGSINIIGNYTPQPNEGFFATGAAFAGMYGVNRATLSATAAVTAGANVKVSADGVNVAGALGGIYGSYGIAYGGGASSNARNTASVLETAMFTADGSMQMDGGRNAAGTTVHAMNGDLLVLGAPERFQAIGAGLGSDSATAVASAVVTAGTTLNAAVGDARVMAHSYNGYQILADVGGAVRFNFGSSGFQGHHTASASATATLAAGSGSADSLNINGGYDPSHVYGAGSILVMGAGHGAVAAAYGDSSGAATVNVAATMSAGGNVHLAAGAVKVNGNQNDSAVAAAYGASSAMVSNTASLNETATLSAGGNLVVNDGSYGGDVTGGNTFDASNRGYTAALAGGFGNASAVTNVATSVNAGGSIRISERAFNVFGQYGAASALASNGYTSSLSSPVAARAADAQVSTSATISAHGGAFYLDGGHGGSGATAYTNVAGSANIMNHGGVYAYASGSGSHSAQNAATATVTANGFVSLSVSALNIENTGGNGARAIIGAYRGAPGGSAAAASMTAALNAQGHTVRINGGSYGGHANAAVGAINIVGLLNGNGVYAEAWGTGSNRATANASATLTGGNIRIVTDQGLYVRGVWTQHVTADAYGYSSGAVKTAKATALGSLSAAGPLIVSGASSQYGGLAAMGNFSDAGGGIVVAEATEGGSDSAVARTAAHVSAGGSAQIAANLINVKGNYYGDINAYVDSNSGSNTKGAVASAAATLTAEGNLTLDGGSYRAGSTGPFHVSQADAVTIQAGASYLVAEVDGFNNNGQLTAAAIAGATLSATGDIHISGSSVGMFGANGDARAYVYHYASTSGFSGGVHEATAVSGLSVKAGGAFTVDGGYYGSISTDPALMIQFGNWGAAYVKAQGEGSITATSKVSSTLDAGGPIHLAGDNVSVGNQSGAQAFGSGYSSSAKVNVSAQSLVVVNAHGNSLTIDAGSNASHVLSGTGQVKISGAGSMGGVYAYADGYGSVSATATARTLINAGRTRISDQTITISGGAYGEASAEPHGVMAGGRRTATGLGSASINVVGNLVLNNGFSHYGGQIAAANVKILGVAEPYNHVSRRLEGYALGSNSGVFSNAGVYSARETGAITVSATGQVLIAANNEVTVAGSNPYVEVAAYANGYSGSQVVTATASATATLTVGTVLTIDGGEQRTGATAPFDVQGGALLTIAGAGNGVRAQVGSNFYSSLEDASGQHTATANASASVTAKGDMHLSVAGANLVGAGGDSGVSALAFGSTNSAKAHATATATMLLSAGGTLTVNGGSSYSGGKLRVLAGGGSMNIGERGFFVASAGHDANSASVSAVATENATVEANGNIHLSVGRLNVGSPGGRVVAEGLPSSCTSGSGLGASATGTAVTVINPHGHDIVIDGGSYGGVQSAVGGGVEVYNGVGELMALAYGSGSNHATATGTTTISGNMIQMALNNLFVFGGNVAASAGNDSGRAAAVNVAKSMGTVSINAASLFSLDGGSTAAGSIHGAAGDVVMRGAGDLHAEARYEGFNSATATGTVSVKGSTVVVRDDGEVGVFGKASGSVDAKASADSSNAVSRATTLGWAALTATGKMVVAGAHPPGQRSAAGSFKVIGGGSGSMKASAGGDYSGSASAKFLNKATVSAGTTMTVSATNILVAGSTSSSNNDETRVKSNVRYQSGNHGLASGTNLGLLTAAGNMSLDAGASHYGGVSVADGVTVAGAITSYGGRHVYVDAASETGRGSNIATLTSKGAIVTGGDLNVSALSVNIVGGGVPGGMNIDGYSSGAHATGQYLALGVMSASGTVAIDGGRSQAGAVGAANNIDVEGMPGGMDAIAGSGSGYGTMNVSATGVARLKSGALMHLATRELSVIGVSGDVTLGAYGDWSSGYAVPTHATVQGSGSASIAAGGALLIDGGTSASYGGHPGLDSLSVVGDWGNKAGAYADNYTGPGGRNSAELVSTAKITSVGRMAVRVSGTMLVAGNMASSDTTGAFAEAYGDSSAAVDVATVTSTASVAAGGALTVKGAKVVSGAGTSSQAAAHLEVYGVLTHAGASASDEGSNVAKVINTATLSGQSVTLSVSDSLVVAGVADSSGRLGATGYADYSGSNGAVTTAAAAITATGSLEVDGGRPLGGGTGAVGSLLVYGNLGENSAGAGYSGCCGVGEGIAHAFTTATATLKSGTGMVLHVANRLAVAGVRGGFSYSSDGATTASYYGKIQAHAGGDSTTAKNVALAVSNATISAGGDLTVTGAVASANSINAVNSIEVIGGAGEYGFASGSGSNRATAQAGATLFAGGNMDLRVGQLTVAGNNMPNSGSYSDPPYYYSSHTPVGAVAGASGYGSYFAPGVNIGKVVSSATVQAKGDIQVRGGLSAGANKGFNRVEILGAGYKTTAYAGGYSGHEFSSYSCCYPYEYSHNSLNSNGKGYNRGIVNESGTLSAGGNLTLEGANSASLKVRGNNYGSDLKAGGTSVQANDVAMTNATALVSVGGNLGIFGSASVAAGIRDVEVTGVYSSQIASASYFGGRGYDQAVGQANASIQVKGNIAIRTEYLVVRGGRVADSNGSTHAAYARGSSAGARLQTLVSAAGLMSAGGNITVKGPGASGASGIAVYGANGPVIAEANYSSGSGSAGASAFASGTVKSGKNTLIKVQGSNGLEVFGAGYDGTSGLPTSVMVKASAGGSGYKSVGGAVVKATGTLTVSGTLTVVGSTSKASAAVNVFGSTGGKVSAYAQGQGLTAARAKAIGLITAANASVTVGAIKTLNVMGGDSVYAEASASQDIHHPRHGANVSARAFGDGSLVVSGTLTLSGTNSVTVTGGNASAGVDDGSGTILYGTESAQAHADANLLWSTISKPAGLAVNKTDGTVNSFGTPTTAISVSAVGDPPPIPAPGSITSGTSGLQPTVGAPVIQLGPNAIDLGSQVPGAYLLLDGAASTLNLGVDSGPVQFLPPGVEQDLQALNAAGLFGLYPGAALAIDLGDNNIVIVSEDGELYFGPGTLAGSSQVRTLEQVAEVTSTKK